MSSFFFPFLFFFTKVIYLRIKDFDFPSKYFTNKSPSYIFLPVIRLHMILENHSKINDTSLAFHSPPLLNHFPLVECPAEVLAIRGGLPLHRGNIIALIGHHLLSSFSFYFRNQHYSPYKSYLTYFC